MLQNSLIKHIDRNLGFRVYRVLYSSEHRRVPAGKNGFKQRPDASQITADYIGPPDPKSNLRPIIRYKPAHETTLERKLRLKRIEVEEWNQNTWQKHNNDFYQQKLEFMQKHRTDDSEHLSADKMSEFYKTFLDRNWKFHFNYNWEWYKKNFDILLLALQVNLTKMFRRRPKTTNRPGSS